MGWYWLVLFQLRTVVAELTRGDSQAKLNYRKKFDWSQIILLIACHPTKYHHTLSTIIYKIIHIKKINTRLHGEKHWVICATTKPSTKYSFKHFWLGFNISILFSNTAWPHEGTLQVYVWDNSYLYVQRVKLKNPPTTPPKLHLI